MDQKDFISGVKRMSLPLSGVETELDMKVGDVQVSDRNSFISSQLCIIRASD